MNYLSKTRAKIKLILPAAVVDLIIRDSCHLDPTHTAVTQCSDGTSMALVCYLGPRDVV